MDHHSIDSSAVVERYVTGRLDEDTAARFEEHYLDCTRCVAAVEDAERLARGLAAMAEQETDGAASTPAAGIRRPAGQWLALAAVLVMAVLAVMAWQARRIGELRTRLAATGSPQLVTAIIEVGALRAGGDTVQRLRLGEEPEWLVLAVPVVPDDGPHDVRLSREGGGEVWRADQALVGPDGRIAFGIHTSILVPGRYRLRVEDGSGVVRLDQRLAVEAPE